MQLIILGIIVLVIWVYIDDKKQEWDIYNSITDKFKAEKELYFEKF